MRTFKIISKTGAAAVLLLAGLAASAAAQTNVAPAQWRAAWPNTNFSTSSVAFSDILSGGPGKDGIPSVDAPEFDPVSIAILEDREPVIALRVNGDSRAYPLRYMIWHEIVNDVVGGVPVAATYCPLCNAAMAFDRRVSADVLAFGVSGLLRDSDMIMYDRQSESWWQQFTGEAIVGARLGQQLTVLPAALVSWAEFRQIAPNGRVMRAPDGYARPYGVNPYVGYDSLAQPFLYDGAPPPHGIAPLSRVVRVGNRAWPLARVAAAGGLVEDGVRLTWRPGQASALDSARIAEGRDVGGAAAYDALTGALLPHDVVFAFAFHAFHPQGRWMLGD